MSVHKSQPSSVCRIVGATLFLLAVPLAGLGCSYVSNPDPPMEYIVSRTKVIFLGTLLRKTFQVRKEEGVKYRVHSLNFRIDQKLKGEERTSHQIEYWEKISRLNSCDVGPPNPKVGEQWLIFSDYDEEGDSLENVLNPDHLSRRYLPDDVKSQTDLKAITGAISFPQSTFYGQVEMAMIGAPSDKHRLKAELLNSARSAVLQQTYVEKGRFSFPNLEPGNYGVRLRSSKEETLLAPIRAQMQQDEGDPPYFADYSFKMLPSLPEFRNFTLNW